MDISHGSQAPLVGLMLSICAILKESISQTALDRTSLLTESLTIYASAKVLSPISSLACVNTQASWGIHVMARVISYLDFDGFMATRVFALLLALLTVVQKSCLHCRVT
jgi:hypothetical protein